MSTVFYDSFQGSGELIQDHTSDSGGGWLVISGSVSRVFDGLTPIPTSGAYGYNVYVRTGLFPTAADGFATVVFNIPSLTGGTSDWRVGLLLKTYTAGSSEVLLEVASVWDPDYRGLYIATTAGPDVYLPAGMLVVGDNTLSINVEKDTGYVQYVVNGVVVATETRGALNGQYEVQISMASSDSVPDVYTLIKAMDAYLGTTPFIPTPVVDVYWWQRRVNVDVEPQE